MPHSTTDFWQFANQVYEQPGVAAACLWLQDRHGADVMVVLFCLWAGHRAVLLSGDDLDRLRRHVGAWRDGVIQPLRAARRWLKQQPYTELRDGAEALRAALKDSELRAEALQARLLEQRLASLDPTAAPAGGDAAAANLRGYLTALGIPPSAGQVPLTALCAGARAVLAPPRR